MNRSTKTRVKTLTSLEVERLSVLVEELRATGYVHASDFPRLGNLASDGYAAGVTVLQIVRRWVPDRVAIFERRDAYLVNNPPVFDDISIERFGAGRPVIVETEVTQETITYGADDGARFGSNEMVASDGLPLRDPDAVRLAVGPWYPRWFADLVPALLRSAPTGRTRVIGKFVRFEDVRKAFDSARRLGGDAAEDGLLEGLLSEPG